MLPKEDRKAMLLRLFGEITPLRDTSKDRFLKAKNAALNGAAVSDINGEIKEEVKADDTALDKDDLQAIMDATSDEEADVEESTV